jgi:ABC-2 type transport system ATP-binding protein
MRSLLATAALLVLGAAAFARLPLDYLPRQSFPEITVSLRLPEARDPEEVARDHVEAIESAIRSLGRVRGTDGEVRPDGAEIRVRLAPGTDPGRKAARLEAELDRLRRRLPEGARLRVEPAAREDGDLLAIVWLTGASRESDAERAAEVLRSVPGVRAVEVLGTGREEVRVELASGLVDPRGTAAAVRAAVERSLRAPALGRIRRGDREIPLVAPPADPAVLAFLPIPAPERGAGALPLGSLATIRERRGTPVYRVRFQGRPAFALFVARSHGAPLLATDSALRERLAALPAGLRGVVDWSDAEPLRELLGRLLLGALLASLAAAAAGWRLTGRSGALSLGLAIPAGAAAAANAFWLAGFPLHLLTLTALALGVAAALPVAARRLAREGSFLPLAVTTLAAAAAVPAVAPLAGAELEPLLGEPARAFFLAAAAAILAAGLLPRTSPPPDLTPDPSPISHPSNRERGASTLWVPSSPLSRGLGGRWERGAGGVRSGGGSSRPPKDGPGGQGVRSLQRRALRDPGTALLGLAAAGAVAVTLFGGALVPRSGDLSSDGGSFTLFLPLPEGSTLEESERLVRGAEEVFARTPEVIRFWSSAQAGRALLVAEVRPGDRQPDRLAALATRLRYQIPGAAAARIDTGLTAAGGRGLRIDPEERARADEEGFAYRAVLRSADLRALRAAHDRLLARLEQLKIRSHWITAWGTPSVVLSLHPVAGTTPAAATGLADALREASWPPLPVPLPRRGAEGAERALVVVPAGAPLDPERHVPAAGTLLGRPVLLGGRAVSPAASLALREEIVQPRIARQSGRFVLPIEVQLPLKSEELRLGRRKEMDRNLGRLALPPGVDLERPSLSPAVWQSERLRLALPALLLPLLLATVAAWRLGAPLRALAVLVPLAAGLIAAAPVVQAGLGQIDEPGLFALAAALALTLAPAAELAGGGGDAPGRLWRTLRRETPWLLAAALPITLLLAVPTLGADPIQFRWVVPLRTAAVATAVAFLATALITPPLRLAASRWRSLGPEEVRRRRQPPAWSEPAPPVLEIRGLTKTYASGLTALSAMTVRLEPGIVGLLGPNGAGKTTLLRVLTGLLEPTRGHVLFRGVPVTPENLAEYRRRIGFLPQELNAYPDFTAAQFLDHWALEHGIADPRTRRAEVERWLAAVDLAEHANRKVRDFSGGMRQRVGIARALLGAPPILIVDEPTTGLDIESRNRFRQILLEQAADRVVLFSTHIASDVEAAARRILLLHRGRLRFDGTPEELVDRARGRVFRTLIDDAGLAAIGQQYRVTARVRRLEGIEVRAVARPGQPLAGDLIEPSLEEAYLAEVDLAESEPGRGEERLVFREG